MNLIEAVRLALAETWAMYFKAHSFHWNVRGPLFSQFHGFFGDIYEDLHDAVDTLAERIRTLDAIAPQSLNEIVSGSKIVFTTAGPAAEMIRQLMNDNQVVIAALSDANTAAIAAGKDGLANTLQGRLDVHEKWAWQLKAHLEEATL